MKIAINTKTSGAYEKRFLNNREHIVTKMIPIVGNSIMNRGFYPLTEVQNTFNQLHFLPAPNGHPKIGNELVSAFHPLAMNAFNIGGMVRNPKMDGDKVVNEFWLDVDIANQSDDGQELIKRIENGEEVGVSTGLTVRQEVTNGQHDGQDYDWIANDMSFDHVAILLHETAAGASSGTALVNSEDRNVMVVNVSEGYEPVRKKRSSAIKAVKANAITVHSLEHQLRAAAKEIWPDALWWVWTTAIFPTENTVVFEVESRGDNITTLIRCSYDVDENDQVSLNDDKVEVVKKVEFVEVDGDVNVTNSNPEEDNDMGKKTQSQDVTNSDTLNVENAINLLETKGFKVNTKEEVEQLQFFIDNKDQFEAVINAENVELESLRKDLVANSEMTDDDVAGMSKDMLTRLSNTLNPQQNYSVSSGVAPLRAVSNSDTTEADFESSYVNNYDDAQGGE